MKKRPFCKLMVPFALSMIILATLATSTAQPTEWNRTPEHLAEIFAPYLYLHHSESFYPVSPEYAVSRSNLNRTGVGLVDPSPNIHSIAVHTDPNQGYYLDNRMGTIRDSGIEWDFLASKSEFPPVVHARVGELQGGYVIQYWFFYAHNEGPLNTHEGDWEFIMIFTDSNGVPQRAAYAQHLGGEVAQWDLVDKRGTHPKVYVALGSHASYFRPYQGKLGMANDETSSSGRVLSPDDYQLVMMTDQPWLQFAGHWGDYGSPDAGLLGERGPLGPRYIHDARPWNDPVDWSSDLQELSRNNLRMNWFVNHLFMIIIGIMVLVFLIQILSKIRLKKKQGTLGPRLFPFLYFDSGVRTLGMIIGLVAITIAIIGFFLPWYSVTLNIPSGPYSTPGDVEVLRLDGIKGFQFNRLESGGGLVQMAALPLSFGWLLLFGTFLFFFGTIGTRKSKKMGKKFIGRGIKTLVPVILVVLFMFFLATIISSLGQDIPKEVVTLTETMSSRPLGGTETESLGEYGTADITWGFGIGMYLFMISALLFFVSAALVISSKSDFYQLFPRSGSLERSPKYTPPTPQHQPPPPEYTIPHSNECLTTKIQCMNCGLSYQAPMDISKPALCPRCGFGFKPQ